jgi:hypothetical protein
MKIIDAYRAGKPLCFYLSGFKNSVRLIVALVEHKDGIVVADGNVFDPYASKSTALLSGDTKAEGPPWKLDMHVVDLADKHQLVKNQLEIVDSIDNKPPREAIEEWLKGQFR